MFTFSSLMKEERATRGFHKRRSSEGKSLACNLLGAGEQTFVDILNDHFLTQLNTIPTRGNNILDSDKKRSRSSQRDRSC